MKKRGFRSDRTWSVAGLSALLVLAALTAGAAPAPGRAPLTTGPDLDFPGPGRIVLGLLVAGGVAAAAIVALRPLLQQRWGQGASVGVRIDVIGRVALSRDTRLHVLQVANTVVVVCEGKGAISTLAIPGSPLDGDPAGHDAS